MPRLQKVADAIRGKLTGKTSIGDKIGETHFERFIMSYWV